MTNEDIEEKSAHTVTEKDLLKKVQTILYLGLAIFLMFRVPILLEILLPHYFLVLITYILIPIMILVMLILTFRIPREIWKVKNLLRKVVFLIIITVVIGLIIYFFLMCLPLIIGVLAILFS